MSSYEGSQHENFHASGNFPGAGAVVDYSAHQSGNCPVTMAKNMTSQRKMVKRSGIGDLPNEISNKSNSLHNPHNWQGRSGDFYGISAIELENFVLTESNIYLLVAKGRALWIGTARDLIDDSASRAQFRTALKLSSSAYKIPKPKSENKQFSLVADLQLGHLVPAIHAA